MTGREEIQLPQPGSLRGRLPQLNPSEMALRNRAYAAPAARLDAGQVLVWQGQGLGVSAGRLSCNLAGERFFLAADNLSVLEPRLKGFESFVPSEAYSALVEHALAPVLELIERWSGAPVECGDYQRSAELHAAPPSTGSVCVGFSLLAQDGQVVAQGWVQGPEAFWGRLDFTRTPAASSARHRAVPIHLAVELGRCRLPLQALRDLSIGDALRISPRLGPATNPLPVQLVARGGQHRCKARLMGDHLVLETVMNKTIDNTTHSLPSHGLRAPTMGANGAMPGMPPMPTLAGATASAAPSGASDELLKDIECELTFQLGSLRMTVAEIAQLRVGQSLMPGVRLQDQPIRLLVNGRQIGRGELAAVGDELVVVVTETGGLPAV